MEISKFFRKNKKEIPEDYWFEVVKNLYEKLGTIPDPLQIRAAILIDALGIPSGPYSSLEISKEGKRVNPERDRIIAKYLTNKAGVWIDEKAGIYSFDFRDIYPRGLPRKLKKVLPAETLKIMEIEYRHREDARRKFLQTKDYYEIDYPINYFRLPGGVELLLKGYEHYSKWHEKHQSFLAEMNKYAKVIVIEGGKNIPFGESLDFLWTTENVIGHYDLLMRQAVDAGFNGLFTEIDARDTSKIAMDNIKKDDDRLTWLFPDLPDDFFVKYFEYLQREHPNLTKIIKSPQDLKKFLIYQSSIHEKGGLFVRKREKELEIIYKGVWYAAHPYITEKEETSVTPTSLELGQHLFADALAAIKLHLIAQLMVDGYIEKGPIIDYIGSLHLTTKSFFLKYSQYAMLVVLRTINELMAGRVENLKGIKNVFQNPNWPEIIREITRLVFKKVEGNELKDVEIDFLKTYGIDLQSIMQSDEEIKEIQERLKKIIKYENKK